MLYMFANEASGRKIEVSGIFQHVESAKIFVISKSDLLDAWGGDVGKESIAAPVVADPQHLSVPNILSIKSLKHPKDTSPGLLISNTFPYKLGREKYEKNGTFSVFTFTL